MPAYFFEVYTKNPRTLEEGWDIKVGVVLAVGPIAGRHRVQAHYGRLFDEFIQFHETGEREHYRDELFILRSNRTEQDERDAEQEAAERQKPNC
jgi:hypothetical protein